MHRRELLKMSAIVLGTAASASITRALLADGPLTIGFDDTVFTPDQQTAIVHLSDMIIPPTDTPGAVAAGVPDFVATIVAEWYTDKERAVFFQGLEALDKYCLDSESTPFHTATETTRVAALREQEALAKAYMPPQPKMALSRPPEDESAPFFKKIKELVVLGYYTSEVGARQELIYLPMPGYYDGNIDFSSIGRQWIS